MVFPCGSITKSSDQRYGMFAVKSLLLPEGALSQSPVVGQ